MGPPLPFAFRRGEHDHTPARHSAYQALVSQDAQRVPDCARSQRVPGGESPDARQERAGRKGAVFNLPAQEIGQLDERRFQPVRVNLTQCPCSRQPQMHMLPLAESLSHKCLAGQFSLPRVIHLTHLVNQTNVYGVQQMPQLAQLAAAETKNGPVPAHTHRYRPSPELGPATDTRDQE